MTDSIMLTTTIPASPKAIYDAWLDSRKHGDMTGGDASVDGRVGGLFTAWGDYIEGATRELVANQRIVQEWRTSEFPPNAPDSLVEITLEAVGGSCKLTLKHSKLPDGDGPKYTQGWEDYYFKPMKEYFARFAQNDRKKPREGAKPAKKGKAKAVPRRTRSSRKKS
jgi:activator of HSP90 ATPase